MFWRPPLFLRAGVERNASIEYISTNFLWRRCWAYLAFGGPHISIKRGNEKRRILWDTITQKSGKNTKNETCFVCTIFHQKNSTSGFWGMAIHQILHTNSNLFCPYGLIENIFNMYSHWFSEDYSQCGSYWIFMLFRFYVKSILESLKVLKLRFLLFLDLWIFFIW